MVNNNINVFETCGFSYSNSLYLTKMVNNNTNIFETCGFLVNNNSFLYHSRDVYVRLLKKSLYSHEWAVSEHGIAVVCSFDFFLLMPSILDLGLVIHRRSSNSRTEF